MQITKLARNGFVSLVGELIPCLIPANSLTTFHKYQVSVCVLFMDLPFHDLAENDNFI